MKRPFKPCPTPGCPKLTRHGYCEDHSKPQGRHHDLYNTPRWIKERRAYLIEHPLCRSCTAKGRMGIAAREVDHIKPHRGDLDLFWDRGNWQGLCVPCHREKTARGE